MTAEPTSFVARFFEGPKLRYEAVTARDGNSAFKKIKIKFPAATSVDIVHGTAREARALRNKTRMWPLT